MKKQRKNFVYRINNGGNYTKVRLMETEEQRWE